MGDFTEMRGLRELGAGWGAQPEESSGKARFGESGRQTDGSFYVIREHSAHCVINLKILTQRNYGKYKSEKLDQDAQPCTARHSRNGLQEGPAGGGARTPPPRRTPESTGARGAPQHRPPPHTVSCVWTPPTQLIAAGTLRPCPPPGPPPHTLGYVPRCKCTT